jgi:4-amino-4-deoxy-L-arabinose transferase-like glycosyltransferase
LNFWLLLAPLVLGLPAGGLWLWLIDPDGRTRLGAREAALWTAVLVAALGSAIGLSLSLGAGHDPSRAAAGALTRGGVLLAWLPFALAGIVLIARRRGLVRPALAARRAKLSGLCPLDRYLVVASLVCAALVVLVALLAAPTTWDSMTYHLARVAAWLQLGGVSHYATSSLPQLFQPPGAELAIAQLQAIVGGDRLASCVQALAYLCSIGAASLIAKRLGGGRRAQLLAAFLLASSPMAIMQGSSTQNDLLLGLWLMVATVLALTVLEDDRLAVPRGLVASTAVALALLTKGTAWIFLPPILLLLAFALIRRVGPARFAAIALFGFGIVFLLNASSWLENHQTFGQYAYSDDGNFDYSTDRHGPSTLVSNLVRNSAIYIGTPSRDVNERLTDATSGALGALGIDADDPASTFPGLAFKIPRAGPDESHGPSVLLFVLGLWALALALFAGGFRTRARLALALVVLADVLLFALLIKWQTWHSRLHLPVVLLAIPLIAVALAEWPGRRERRLRLTVAVVALASLLAPVYLALNVDRPLISYAGHRSILTTPRAAQYFAARPELEAPYLSVTGEIRARGLKQVGMIGGFDDWYYPLSALLGKGARTSYLLVPNASARYPQRDPAELDAVVCLSCDAPTRERLRAGGLSPTPGQYFHIPATSSQHGLIVELWTR